MIVNARAYNTQGSFFLDLPSTAQNVEACDPVIDDRLQQRREEPCCDSQGCVQEEGQRTWQLASSLAGMRRPCFCLRSAGRVMRFSSAKALATSPDRVAVAYTFIVFCCTSTQGARSETIPSLIPSLVFHMWKLHQENRKADEKHSHATEYWVGSRICY